MHFYTFPGDYGTPKGAETRPETETPEDFHGISEQFSGETNISLTKLRHYPEIMTNPKEFLHQGSILVHQKRF